MKKIQRTQSALQKLLKRKWVIPGLITNLILGIGLFVRSLMVTPQVAEIAGKDIYSCTSNVASLSFQQQCAFGSFKASSFTCRYSDRVIGTVYPTCKSYTEIMAEVQKVCGQSCIYPSSTPYPTRTPMSTPVPSRTPYPTRTPMSSPAPSVMPTPTPPTGQVSISCNVKVYKLKATDDVSANPKLYATSDRLVDPAQTRIKPGDTFALLVDATSNDFLTAATVSAVTSNVAGSDEPIKVMATTPYCSSTDSWGKYMSCTHPGVTYSPGVTNRLDIGMTVQIQDNVYSQAKTSVRFGLYNILASGTGYSSECYATMMAAETSSTPVPTTLPKPTPTATPMPPSGCYYERSTCFSGLFGGECKLLLKCESPKPTPMGTPVASGITSSTVAPTMRPTPTPFPIAPEGCYYRRRFCLGSFIGGTCPPALTCPKPIRQTYAQCVRACRANTSYARCLRTCLAR